uniref:Keratin n=1 Tax=Junco hyemalis TaxID=40217 RepID=A0A8C5IVD4_JUNHY
MSCYERCPPTSCGPTPLANSCSEPCVRQCQDSTVVIQPSPVVVTLPGPILSSFAFASKNSLWPQPCPATTSVLQPPAAPRRWPTAATSPVSGSARTPPWSSSRPPWWSPCPGPSSAPFPRTPPWDPRRPRLSGALQRLPQWLLRALLRREEKTRNAEPRPVPGAGLSSRPWFLGATRDAPSLELKELWEFGISPDQAFACLLLCFTSCF